MASYCGLFARYLILTLLAASPAFAQIAKPQEPPLTIFDARLATLRKASVTWDVRCGPDRQVVDVVCLVPDVPTFLEVLKVWDRGHYFPILLDDVELNLRFLRAFRPAKVVRFPKTAPAIPNSKLMEEAIAAVGYSWREPGSDEGLPGGTPPELSPPPPPGIVLSNGKSPSLAAAAALAAGHFEPLTEWKWDQGRDAILEEDAALNVVNELDAIVRRVIPKYHGMGDSCDFITLAAEWPYRYRTPKIANNDLLALDDLLGRDPGTEGTRAAFTGRLIGSENLCVYQAMCSLFLTANSATLFDSYDEKSPTWASYSMSKAKAKLAKILPVTIWSAAGGPGPSLWHRAFDPVNSSRLVMVNSSGGATVFSLPTHVGRTADIPFSTPAAVHFLHSFSATDPYNPDTIAARWLANGAYVYYGSMNEPYLGAFRTSELMADLLTFNLPLVAVFRQDRAEALGGPWRLMYFGDPLCRLRPVHKPGPRLAEWASVNAWPIYPSTAVGKPPAAEDARLAWALQIALGSVGATKPDPKTAKVLYDALSTIPDGRLPPPLRPVLEALCVDVYLETGHLSALRSRLSAVSDADLNNDVRRWRDTVALIELYAAMQAKDTTRVGVIWEAIVRSDTSIELKLALVERLTPFFTGLNRSVIWNKRLQASRSQFEGTASEDQFLTILKKVEASIVSNRAKSK